MTTTPPPADDSEYLWWDDVLPVFALAASLATSSLGHTTPTSEAENAILTRASRYLRFLRDGSI